MKETALKRSLFFVLLEKTARCYATMAMLRGSMPLSAPKK